MNNESYQNGVHCLATYQWHSMPRARLAILWSGIEGLFGIDSEIFSDESICSQILGARKRRETAQYFFKNVKNLYKLHSKDSPIKSAHTLQLVLN